MSRTEQSWSCSDQRVRAGIAHGLRMVRLHVGDCYVSALFHDDDTTTIIIIWRDTPTLTNATPCRIMESNVRTSALQSNLETVLWELPEKHFRHHRVADNKKMWFWERSRATFGKPNVAADAPSHALMY